MLLLRNKPILKYSGLTIILSNPSRFDVTNRRLLSSTGGILLQDNCLQPDFNLMQCDIRVMEDNSPLIEGTKCLLLLGEHAMHFWSPDTNGNTLNEMRGSPLKSRVQGIPAIASYFPQDAADFKAYEQSLNKESKEYSPEEESDSEDDEGDVKRFSPTKRSNYAFWLKADVGKCKAILKNGLSHYIDNPSIPKANFHLYPPADEVVTILNRTKGQTIDFDMETDYEEQNMLCFSFSVDGYNIYSVPVLNFNYKWSYSNLHLILRALAVACRDNEICAHNGAAFDFLVLAIKYNIAIYKPYDSMIAMHRCFPDVEKSLGHCTSFWTWETFHKDTDSKSYYTQEHMMKKLLYCAKDVYTMGKIRRSITTYAKIVPGLESSIKCAQDSIKPYMLAMLQGVKYSVKKATEMQSCSDRLMMQYLRMIKLLIGEDGMSRVEECIKGRAGAFAGSNKQCCEYFHNLLGYPVLYRTDTGAPSLAKKLMYRLALKHPDNPVIQLVLAYRLEKEVSKKMTFVPWKDDNDHYYKEPVNTNKNNLFPL